MQHHGKRRMIRAALGAGLLGLAGATAAHSDKAHTKQKAAAEGKKDETA